MNNVENKLKIFPWCHPMEYIYPEKPKNYFKQLKQNYTLVWLTRVLRYFITVHRDWSITLTSIFAFVYTKALLAKYVVEKRRMISFEKYIFIFDQPYNEQAMFVAIHCHEPLAGAPPNPSIRRKYSAATRSENAFLCILESSK